MNFQKQKVKLISHTPNPEKHIAYCARVSNPTKQDSDEFRALINYCIRESHWSIFEMANFVFEIDTTLAIAQQLTRHKTMSFQMLSRRYTNEKLGFILSNARRQDTKNRQNSIDDLPERIKEEWQARQEYLYGLIENEYNWALEMGIAKECARFILPSSTLTTVIANTNVRTLIHYIELREGNGTQLEHAEIADEMKRLIIPHLPIISEVLGWNI